MINPQFSLRNPTLFYGVLNLPNRFFTFVNASQDPPFLFRGDQVIRLETGGLPVGILHDATFEEELIPLLAGDLLVIFTDGYTEGGSPDDDIFGEERLQEIILKNRHKRPKKIIKALDKALKAFMGNSKFGDDRTIIVLKVHPETRA